MNADTRRQIIERAHERELALIDTKGREYTGGAEQGNDLDTLANFKRVAERTGLNALQVWGVYFLKHVDAIGTYLQDPTRETSEPITGRIDDARTYLGLLECLLVDLDPVEQRNSKPPYQLLVKAERRSDALDEYIPADYANGIGKVAAIGDNLVEFRDGMERVEFDIPDLPEPPSAMVKTIDEIATESCKRSVERLADRMRIDARSPRAEVGTDGRCAACGSTKPIALRMTDSNGVRIYCSDECAKAERHR